VEELVFQILDSDPLTSTMIEKEGTACANVVKIIIKDNNKRK